MALMLVLKPRTHPNSRPCKQAVGMVLESLKQPVINGYLIAGSLVGPGGLKLVKVPPLPPHERDLHPAFRAW